VKRAPIVAVDGPAGAGKSTVARKLAQKLGFQYVDTGAMYRALALRALESGVDLRDEDAVSSLLADVDLTLSSDAEGRVRVRLDGEDVTDRIRTPEVNASVSLVAGYAAVRRSMTRRQREMAEAGGVVMDGRDIGTDVLPDADVKVFLTASLRTRARRRQEELSRQGFHLTLDQLMREIGHRDRLDRERPVAPLRRADDAILVDSTALTVDEVVERILTRVRDRRD
jgi:cytidylate kinase